MESVSNVGYSDGVRNILFLCYGNVYRSQWAEGFFSHFNKDTQYRAISAGRITSVLTQDSIDLMSEREIDIHDNFSKQVTPEMIQGAYKIYDFTDYDLPLLPEEKLTRIVVKDPISEDIETQREIRDEIGEKVIKILEDIGQ